MKTYDWIGIGIRSDMELPLTPAHTAGDDAVVIVRGPVAEALEHPRAIFPFFQAHPGALLLNIPRVARFMVENGSRITVDPYPEANADDIWTFLLGSALGAICHQRGFLPLHASSVQVGDGCVAFGGVSGAGKSTIAAFLANRGYPVVADDQSVVLPGSEGPVVRPGLPRLKLWKDGLAELNADATGLARVRGRLDKYHLPTGNGHSSAPLRLRRLYILADGADRVRIDRLSGIAALEAVRQTVYRRQFVPALDQVATSFRLCAAVAASVEVSVLTRPRKFECITNLIEDLEAEWSPNSD